MANATYDAGIVQSVRHISTLGVALAKIAKHMLQTFQLTDKVVAYVKDEGSSLATLVVALSSRVHIIWDDIAPCWHLLWHPMSKACQYATMDEKVCGGMSKVRISKAQATLQKTITWTKLCCKLREGEGESKELVAVEFVTGEHFTEVH